MTAATACGLLVAVSIGLASPCPPGPRWKRRLAAPRSRRSGADQEPRRAVVAVVAATGLAWVVAGALGVIAGIATGAVAGLLLDRAFRRLEPAAARQRRQRIARDLPGTLDLVAACLGSGAATPIALATAAEATGGPLGDVLAAVAAALSVGVDPVAAWALAERDEAVAPVGRVVARAVDSGAALVDVITGLADETRRSRALAAATAARRVGVSAVAPLGVCFLPAFVVLAVVPVVAGLASAIRT